MSVERVGEQIDLFISHYIKRLLMFKTVCVNYPNTQPMLVIIRLE